MVFDASLPSTLHLTHSATHTHTCTHIASESAGYGGMRPMHFAANFAREPALALLIKSGADVDSKDDGGNTPLHWYAQHTHSIR